MGSMVHSVRFKLLAAFGLCLALLLATGVFGVMGLIRLNSNMADAYTGNTLPIVQLGELRAAQLDARLQLRRAQLVKDDPAQVRTFVEALRKDMDQINSSWKQYFPASITSEEERRIANKFNGALPQFNASMNDTVSALQAGQADKAVQIIDRQAAASTEMGDLLEQDIAINVAQAKDFAADSDATYHRILVWAIVLVCAGFAVGVGMCWYLLRAISRPLSRAVNVANDIAGGKLENGIVVDTQGEFRELLVALRKMDEQLTETVRGIKVSAESVTVASKEIAAGNIDLSSRTEQQAASLEETASSMTQLTETVKQNAENAAQADALASNASTIAQAGNVAVQAMVGTIDQISTSSGKISEIIATIESIAFQTNILALNAAVEAARAGEEGRGFAVVAGEVRSLAQRSAQAAAQSKEIIRASDQSVRDGVALVHQADATMTQIVQSVQTVTQLMSEISASSREQSSGIAQINDSVSQLDGVTQQNATLVEEAAAATSVLARQSEELKHAVAVFRA